MKNTESFSREGYLRENYHFFHLRDTAGQERDFHFHEFDKVVILLSGRVDYAVEDATYTLKPWDVLLVKHHTIHKALIDQTEPYERVIIYLDRNYFDQLMPQAGLLKCFDAADQRQQYLFTPAMEQRKELESTLNAYEQAAAKTEFGTQAMLDSIMIQLLIRINRISISGLVRTEKGEVQTDSRIAAALSYINENLTLKLDVGEIAERVFLSRYHFMRLFKTQTGTTVHAYIRQKRLLYASRLIREGMPAAEAASKCGFADYSGFHRAFRDCFGISPGQLKSQSHAK
ncbi:MAG: AraC family transcriptional regulator [Lachnospiraceae bacterium]|nr:AraC family transcriptional regulator [Lachnospiraceae bacterium]